MKGKRYTWGDIAMIGLCIYGLAVCIFALIREIPRPIQGTVSPAVTLVLIYTIFRNQKNKEIR